MRRKGGRRKRNVESAGKMSCELAVRLKMGWQGRQRGLAVSANVAGAQVRQVHGHYETRAAADGLEDGDAGSSCGREAPGLMMMGAGSCVAAVCAVARQTTQRGSAREWKVESGIRQGQSQG